MKAETKLTTKTSKSKLDEADTGKIKPKQGVSTRCTTPHQRQEGSRSISSLSPLKKPEKKENQKQLKALKKIESVTTRIPQKVTLGEGKKIA